MKKLIAFALAGLVAGSALAGLDYKDYSVTVTNTGANSAVYVIRGEIQAVRVVVPATHTCQVAVVSAENTILSKSGITSSSTFTPRILTDSTAGASSTNAIYGQIATAGAVTTTVTGASSGTNTYTVRVIYKD